MKLLLPVIEPGAFARGICASSAAATGLIRPAGIWLLANCVRVHTPCALQVVVSGSTIGMSAPAALGVSGGGQRIKDREERPRRVEGLREVARALQIGGHRRRGREGDLFV